MPDLASLSCSELESVWSACLLNDDFDLSDAVVSELVGRPDARPQSYDLMWEMQDMGWGGGVSQEDRDAR